MELKVGDKVKIKSKEWYNANKDKDGDITKLSPTFVESMAAFCGCIATVRHVNKTYCYLDIDRGDFGWSFEALEPVKGSLIKDIAEIIRSHDMGIIVSEQDNKLIIEPINKEEDLPIDTPCMVKIGDEWSLEYYAGEGCFYCNSKKSCNAGTWQRSKYIIPFDKFDPHNIEESLKYNIAK